MTLPTHAVYVRAGLVIIATVLIAGLSACDQPPIDPEEPVLSGVTSTQTDTLMAHTVAQVKEVRKQSGIDQRAMAIDGVLSVGTTGNGNEDAWIQILVKDDSVAERVRQNIGDTVDGVPVKIAYSDTIRAQ